MYTILITLSIIISFLLIIIVLMQASKGTGLAGTFGGGNVGAMFGVRRTADFLSKATWWLAGTLLVLAIIINLFFLPGRSAGSSTESIIQKGGNQSIPTAPSLPQTNQNR